MQIESLLRHSMLSSVAYLAVPHIFIYLMNGTIFGQKSY